MSKYQYPYVVIIFCEDDKTPAMVQRNPTLNAAMESYDDLDHSFGHTSLVFDNGDQFYMIARDGRYL